MCGKMNESEMWHRVSMQTALIPLELHVLKSLDNCTNEGGRQWGLRAESGSGIEDQARMDKGYNRLLRSEEHGGKNTLE